MDSERINEKILYLNELLFELKEISKMKKADFYKSKRDISAMENYLRKALQIVIDLAEDIVSKKRLGPCDSYYEVFQVLCDNGFLNEDNLSMYKKMVGMRNKIVHEYERISKEILYMVLENNLNDFNIFIEDIRKNFI